MTNAESRLHLRDFLFRGLMFEAEAETLRKAGIEIGAPDAIATESRLLADVISPFSIELRAEALEMSRLYALLYCFENAVRELITTRMTEVHGPDWWTKVSAKVQKKASDRRKSAVDNTWLEGESTRLIAFIDFGDLSSIITDNWADFQDLIPSQAWLRQRFDEMEAARNFVAHHRLLQQSEFQRLYMYVGDYNKQVGL